MTGRLYAISDLHIAYQENRQPILDRLRPSSDADWLIVAEDVAKEVLIDCPREWCCLELHTDLVHFIVTEGTS